MIEFAAGPAAPASGLQLWPHQREALQQLHQALRRPTSRTLIQVPPGTGKTEIAIQGGLDWLRGRVFGRLLFVISNLPVLQQFHRRIAACTTAPIAIEKAELHASRSARIVLASQNSLWDRLDQYPRDTLCIYDECHHSNLDAECNLKIAESFAHVVGLTATPWSHGCQRLFGAPAVFLGLAEAQHRGILAPYELRIWCAPHGPHGLVFCASNGECRSRAEQHPGSSWVGIDSGWVTDRIAAWRAGRIPVLYANRMLLEGFDEPRCSRVWVSKDTQSDITIVQMIGRTLRRGPIGKVAHIYCETEQIRQRVREALQRCEQRAQLTPLTHR